MWCWWWRSKCLCAFPVLLLLHILCLSTGGNSCIFSSILIFYILNVSDCPALMRVNQFFLSNLKRRFLLTPLKRCYDDVGALIPIINNTTGVRYIFMVSYQEWLLINVAPPNKFAFLLEISSNSSRGPIVQMWQNPSLLPKLIFNWYIRRTTDMTLIRLRVAFFIWRIDLF